MSEEYELIQKFSPKVLQRKYETMPQKARIKCLIKILICFLCICGLCYYTSILLYQFFRGRTVVNIKIETALNNHKIPGFTICYPELLSMERIARKYVELKPRFKTYMDYVENTTDGFVSENYTKIVQELYWTNMSKTVENQKLTISELLNLSIPYEYDYEPYPHYPIMIDIDGHRHFRNGSSVDSSVTDEKPMETVVFESNGKMNKCFTFFTHLNKTWRDYFMNIKEINIQITHNSKNFPKCNYAKNHNIKFSMHSPNTLPQTLSVNHFVDLKADNSIEITYSRWKTKLLGPGYQTNCHSYDMDDSTNYRFRSDCINHCIQQQLNECSKEKQRERSEPFKKCLFPTNALWRGPAFILYKDLKLCRHYEKSVSYDCLYWNMGQIETKCQNKCRPECVNRYYYYNIKNSRPWYDGFIQIKIVHDQYPDRSTEHLPEMPLIQFVSNFGGLLGMWLGLSALTILKFVVELL